MMILYVLLGIILTVLLFLNIKNAADILCRIIGGFVIMIIYNTFAPGLGLPLFGVNIISAAVLGLLGLPGGLLVLCLGSFL